MRLAIIGHGRLGSAVGRAWDEKGNEVSTKITSKDSWEAKSLDCDIALESTVPSSAADNIIALLKAGVPVVVGSTGWHQRLDEIEEVVKETKGLVFHATNFSIGVHLLNKFASDMAQTMKSFKEYSPSILESHHIHKLDKPSGTAITLAEKVKQSGEYENFNVDSLREGEIIGTHELTWDSEIDYISIKHFAKNRKGFAMGAVKAALWILELKSKGVSGIFTMDDMIKKIT